MLELTFGEQVKIVLNRKDMTIKQLAEMIEERTGKKMSRQNLTQRLARDNFQEQDMRLIASILECPFHLSILEENADSEYTTRENIKIDKRAENNIIIDEEPQQLTLNLEYDEPEQVQEEQALKAFKGIEEIEVRRYVRSSDRSEGVIIEPAYISHIVKHKRNMLFPLRLINDFFNDKSSLTAVLGIPDEFDGKEEYKVRLRGKDGSSRAFALDGDLRVPVVEVLNESGEAPVADSELINRCREIADGIYDSYGRML